MTNEDQNPQSPRITRVIGTPGGGYHWYDDDVLASTDGIHTWTNISFEAAVPILNIADMAAHYMENDFHDTEVAVLSVADAVTRAGAIRVLGTGKLAGEQDELSEAWFTYLNLLKQENADRHELNSAWLHVIDETADVFNCMVATWLFEIGGQSQLPEQGTLSSCDEDVREDHAADMAALIVYHCGMLEAVYRHYPDDIHEVVSMLPAICDAKLRATALRPHWRQERCDDESRTQIPICGRAVGRSSSA